MAETTTAPIAGPAAPPAPKIALAKPRSDAGNHSRITRLDAGQLVDSPIPMTMRVAAMNRSRSIEPVSTVAGDQRPMPAGVHHLAAEAIDQQTDRDQAEHVIHRKDESR